MGVGGHLGFGWDGRDVPAPQGALPGGVPTVRRAPNAAARQHAARLFPAAGACPRVPSPRPGTLWSSVFLSCRRWSSSARTAPSPKLGREDGAGR